MTRILVGMNDERAQVRLRRDMSRDRVRRMTLVAGATAAVTGGVLAVALAGTSQHVTSSGATTTVTPVVNSGDDDGRGDDGAFATAQQPAQAPAVAQGTGSVTRSGGS